MEINKQILSKYYGKAAVEQLVQQYSLEGYEILHQKEIDGIQTDLIVKKGDETIIFEVKAGDWNFQRRNQIKKLRNFVVHNMNAKFKLVLVEIPQEPEIIVTQIENLIPDLLIEKFNNEFDRLATHYSIYETSDINYRKLLIDDDEIMVQGTGMVTLELQYGSDRDVKDDMGLISYQSFAFSFSLKLNVDYEVVDILELEIDDPDFESDDNEDY